MIIMVMTGKMAGDSPGYSLSLVAETTTGVLLSVERTAASRLPAGTVAAAGAPGWTGWYFVCLYVWFMSVCTAGFSLYLFCLCLFMMSVLFLHATCLCFCMCTNSSKFIVLTHTYILYIHTCRGCWSGTGQCKPGYG